MAKPASTPAVAGLSFWELRWSLSLHPRPHTPHAQSPAEQGRRLLLSSPTFWSITGSNSCSPGVLPRGGVSWYRSMAAGRACFRTAAHSRRVLPSGPEQPEQLSPLASCPVTERMSARKRGRLAHTLDRREPDQAPGSARTSGQQEGWGGKGVGPSHPGGASAWSIRWHLWRWVSTDQRQARTPTSSAGGPCLDLASCRQRPRPFADLGSRWFYVGALPVAERCACELLVEGRFSSEGGTGRV